MDNSFVEWNRMEENKQGQKIPKTKVVSYFLVEVIKLNAGYYVSSRMTVLFFLDARAI